MEFTKELDARGLNCPMPLVRARQELNGLGLGEVLKVIATDKGSLADFKGWAQTAKNVELIAQETETSNGQSVYVHYIKRIS